LQREGEAADLAVGAELEDRERIDDADERGRGRPVFSISDWTRSPTSEMRCTLISNESMELPTA